MHALPSSSTPVEGKSQALTVSTPLTVQDVLGQVALIQQIMAVTMKDGEHYGRIPGCGDKPTLLKPGAEKLCLTFRLAPTYDVDERLFERGHREYRVQCTLTSILTGGFVGQGVGLCSSMEARYRYRAGATEGTDKPVPRSYWDLRQEDPAKAQELIGGKGFSPKKVDGVWMIAKASERVETDNPADTYNTVLKMAKKRALVDAVLTATAASDIFTQDLEDITANMAAESPTPATAPASVAAAPSARRPAQSGSRPTPPAQSAPVEVQAEVIEHLSYLETRVHFGKNRGLMISELTPQQVHWYETDWMPKKEVNGPTTTEDLALINALKAYRHSGGSTKHPLKKAKPVSKAAEDEDQEKTPLLVSLGKLVLEARLSDQALTDWLRSIRRGGKPILAADKTVEDGVPADELRSILKNWHAVEKDVRAFLKKRQDQQTLDEMPLN